MKCDSMNLLELKFIGLKGKYILTIVFVYAIVINLVMGFSLTQCQYPTLCPANDTLCVEPPHSCGFPTEGLSLISLLVFLIPIEIIPLALIIIIIAGIKKVLKK